MKIYLPDVNVWLAFADEAHIHHSQASTWMKSLKPGEAAFCRITQMGMLRLLTNPRVMRQAVLSQAQAWDIYYKVRNDARTLLLGEPDGLETRWRALTSKASSSNELWTDCYLRAFADAADLTIATFDKKFPGVAASGVLVLE